MKKTLKTSNFKHLEKRYKLQRQTSSCDFKQVFAYFSWHMDFLKNNDLSQYVSPHSQVKFANHINSECPELKKVFAKVPNTCQSFEYAPIVHFAPMYVYVSFWAVLMTETTGNLRSIVQLVGINVISLCLMCALCGSKREGQPQPSDTRTQRGRSDELAMLSPLLSLIALSCVC